MSETATFCRVCSAPLTHHDFEALCQTCRDAVSEPATAPAGVIPLSWAESQDELANSRFEALSHIPDVRPATPDEYATGAGCADYWVVTPVLESNRVLWRIEWDSAACPPLRIASIGGNRFDCAQDAMAACERLEIELGGAEHAPRVPSEDPDQSAPLVTDEQGFAPTRTVRSRISRNGGRIHLFRVWAKPDAPEQVIEKRLEGEEFEAALPGFITQQMVQSLVASITKPGGWIIPLVWTSEPLGQVRMECEVHFAAVRGLHWARQLGRNGSTPAKEAFTALPTPSHAMIISIIGETLLRQKAEFDQTLAHTTTEQLQRSIAKNARALGIQSPDPEPEGALSGNVLPATLEDMQAAGVDLLGASLK